MLISYLGNRLAAAERGQEGGSCQNRRMCKVSHARAAGKRGNQAAKTRGNAEGRRGSAAVDFKVAGRSRRHHTSSKYNIP